MKRLNKQFGISLVEVLVALVISVFLLAGIVQVYTGNKTAFRFTNALAEIQENGRFALDTMSQDLRLAGEWGCIEFDSADTNNINNTIAAAKGGLTLPNSMTLSAKKRSKAPTALPTRSSFAAASPARRMSKAPS